MISLSDDYVIAYYSCSHKEALRLIKGKRQTRLSPGRGFWDDPLLALRDANDRANNGDIKKPALIGVIIEPGNRFNLIHPEEYWFITRLLGNARISFDAVYCPVQEDGCGNHCATEQQGRLFISNPRQIKGHFLPEPWQLFNPWLGPGRAWP